MENVMRFSVFIREICVLFTISYEKQNCYSNERKKLCISNEIRKKLAVRIQWSPHTRENQMYTWNIKWLFCTTTTMPIFLFFLFCAEFISFSPNHKNILFVKRNYDTEKTWAYKNNKNTNDAGKIAINY